MPAGGEIKAKLVYYGAHGSGMTANLECIHRKLKKGHRGDLRTEGSGDARYEILPVQLGQIKGFTTSIHVYTVPGGEKHAKKEPPTPRKPTGAQVAEVKAVLAALDDDGRWVEDGRPRHHGSDDPTRRVVDMRTFVRNVGVLRAYLATEAEPRPRP